MLYCFFRLCQCYLLLPDSRRSPGFIVTTDGEIDDQSSMIRFLMYSSDYDVAGIVQVNGVQKDGHSKDKWIESRKLPNMRNVCLI